MTVPVVPADLATTLAQIEATPGISRLRALTASFAQADRDSVAAVLEEAARFCATYLAPLNPIADAQGCALDAGRVRLPGSFAAAWAAYRDGGWPTLDHPVEQGGQGLPLFLSSSVQLLVDRSCPAFGMLPVLQRSAARLLAVHGAEWMRADWVPGLVSGACGASICISEADAGSDAARVRTSALENGDGSWAITGEKMWVSFGDHDLTPRIAHCVLARSPAGLSLFLVPSELSGKDGAGERNAVRVRRIEEKMGLHGSPTCALGFEGATGWLIGAEGRGLAQLFVMITNMRLSAGVQGLGIAAACTDVARAYAAERRQGGPATGPAVAIDTHPDVQRQLLDMAARVEVLRGLGLAIAVQADLAAHETDPEDRARASTLTQWLLPIFKTTGGEIGFEVASDAIQVLGGAGYTREWPVEQALRDVRIATIYEGTTGMQALDLLHRRLWRDGGRGLAVFLETARADLPGCPPAEAEIAEGCFALLEDAARRLDEMKAYRVAAEFGATAFLHLAALAAMGWIAVRLSRFAGDDPAMVRLAAVGRHWLADLQHRAALQHARALSGDVPLSRFMSL